MTNERSDRGRILSRMLKGLGLVGILGTVGATLLITPLAGSGCSDNTGGAGGNIGLGGHVGTGGAGGLTGTGGVTGAGGTWRRPIPCAGRPVASFLASRP